MILKNDSITISEYDKKYHNHIVHTNLPQHNLESKDDNSDIAFRTKQK